MFIVFFINGSQSSKSLKTNLKLILKQKINEMWHNDLTRASLVCCNRSCNGMVNE